MFSFEQFTRSTINTLVIPTCYYDVVWFLVMMWDLGGEGGRRGRRKGAGQNRGFVPHQKIILGKYYSDPQLIYLLLKSILCCSSLLNYVYKEKKILFEYLI